MNVEPDDFGNRLRALAALQGAVLTEAELSHVREWYPRCRGKERWDVREYVRLSGGGAHEYRVVRGTSIQDAYCSAERVRAAAVGAALNELDSEEQSRAQRADRRE